MATTIEVTSGDDLRQEREDARLTQLQVAQAMGSTQQHVSVIEGKAVVRPQTVRRFRDAVSVYTSAERKAS
jgi:transcriptional regulator with XRE-family HTH domain